MLTLVLIATVATASTLAASPTACLAVNLDTGFSAETLRAVVNAAGPGHHLTVQGVCVGTATISQSLTITGIRTETSGAPVLQGDGKGRVLKVQTDLDVLIKDLTIRGGNAGRGGDGGGIYSSGGTLTLRDVIVTKNRAGFGGGVFVTEAGFEPARLVLAGKTRISGNEANGDGGGAHAYATVIMKDSSLIIGNRARGSGGGMYANELVMLDKSRITGNTAVWMGGGIIQGHGDPRRGVVCSPKQGANVFGNVPDDCYRWGTRL